jgi:hypothetical protein
MATAITRAHNDDLKEDWIESLDQTPTHEQVLLDALPSLLPPPAQPLAPFILDPWNGASAC